MLRIFIIINNIFDDCSWCLRHNDMCRPPLDCRLDHHVVIFLQYFTRIVRNTIHHLVRSPTRVTRPMHHSIIGPSRICRRPKNQNKQQWPPPGHSHCWKWSRLCQNPDMIHCCYCLTLIFIIVVEGWLIIIHGELPIKLIVLFWWLLCLRYRYGR